MSEKSADKRLAVEYVQAVAARVNMGAIIRMLAKIEWVVCFFPIAALIGDQVLLHATGHSVLPYSHIDKNYFFVGAFAAIVLCAAVSIQLRSSALGPDAFTVVELPGTKFELPSFGTSEKLVSSFFSKKLRKENTAPVVTYAALMLIAEFTFGTMVAASIFVGYLRG
jgi:hypothetical protein